MKWLPVFPILICMITSILSCFLWSCNRLQKICHIFGSIILLIAILYICDQVKQDGILNVQIGNYTAPFGISIVVDLLSAMMLSITAIITLCVSLYSIVDIDKHHQNLGFYPVFWVLLTGICGAFTTGDLFNLYVWYEVMLIASFVLMGLGHHKNQLDATMKYVAINLIATILLLTAIAMLYGISGTLNMADLSLSLNQLSQRNIVTLIILFLGLAFAIKAALFPLFFWLPASYHTTSYSASSIFAGMLTKVGVYSLIRLVTLLLPNQYIFLKILLVSSALTMLTGVLGAVSQYNFRRLLSFHIISQIGYITMGLAIDTPLSLTAAIFFMAHNIFAKTNLFLISGITYKIGRTSDIRKLGGFYKKFPFLSFLFFIPAFSLAGFPPLSGFWAKFLLFKAIIIHRNYLMVFIGIFVSFLTLYSMSKIWNYAFWKRHLIEKEMKQLSKFQSIFLYVPVIILASVTIFMGLDPQFFFDIIMKVSEQLLNSKLYIEAVLGA